MENVYLSSKITEAKSSDYNDTKTPVKNTHETFIGKHSAKKEGIKEVKNIDVGKMKEKLENLSPDDIIADILRKNKRKNENNNRDQLNTNETYNTAYQVKEKTDAFLENLKNITVNNFLESIKTKNFKEIKSEFERKIEEYNISCKLYRDKKDKELLDYKAQIENSKAKIMELETEKDQLNCKNKKLEEDKKEKEDTIHKLQVKFVIFDRLKPIFEEFFKEYPDDDPKKIIEDIKEKREASFRIIEDMNLLRDKLYKSKKEKNEIFEKDRKVIGELSEKICEVELNNRDKVDRYIDEINSLKSEMSTYMVYKEENMKLQKMLFHLYNKLIERLALDRDINIDKSLMVTEKDFKPNLFDNQEIGQYIRTMLVNSHEDLSGKMLRETIAYANMMLRLYLKEKVNKRFDPVSIFKDLKDLLDRSKGKISEYEKGNDFLKEKVSKYETEIKKLTRDLKFKQIQFENLEKKFEEQFNKKIEKNKEMRGHMKDKQEENSDQDLKLNIQVCDTSKDNSGDIKKRAFSALPVKRKLEKINKQTNKDIYITNEEKIRSARHDKSARRKRSRAELKSVSARPTTSRNLYVRPQTSVTLFKYSHKGEKKTKQLPNKVSLLPLEDLNNQSNSNFKKLELSKNNDKLQREGMCHILPAHSDGFQSLVEHTNKMFLYKYKMNKSSNKNVFTRFKHNMESNIKRLDQAKATADGFEYEIGDKILNDINGMIKKLENKS